MARIIRKTIFALALGIALPAGAASAQEVTGDTVTIVEFGGGGVQGAFRQIAGGRWQEVDSTGKVTFIFTETSRDSESVVLEDAGRGISLTLDIAGQQITYGPIGGQQDFLYQIVSTSAAAESVATAPAAAPAGPRATGFTVKSVVIGNSGKASGEFRQTGKTKWRELDVTGQPTFKFDEVGRSRSKVELEDGDRGVALTLDIDNNVVTYGAIGDSQQTEIYEILSTVAAEPSTRADEAINDYIASLEYKPEILLARPLADSSTSTEVPVPGRHRQGGQVVITTNKPESFSENIDKISVLSVLPPEVFPGALIKANRELVSGRPTPAGLPRSPVTLSMSLQGGERSSTIVEKPEISTVNTAVQDLLNNWNQTKGDATNADAMLGSFEEIQSLTEAQAKLGFNAEWASGSARGMFEGSGSSDKRTLVAIFKQIFYTMSVDTPSAPSEFLAPGLSPEKVKATFDGNNPPAYVNSVDYGRIIVVKAVVDKNELDINAEGEFDQEIRGGKAGGNAEAKFKQKYSSAKFSALVFGGASDGTIFENEDLTGIKSLIRDGMRFSPSNPALPVGYSVRFLKDNSLAKIMMTGDYINYDSVIYPNGWVQLNFKGAYIGQFKVSWDVNGRPDAPYFSGKKTAGWKETVEIPGDAKNVKVIGEGASGLFWEEGPFSKEKFYREAINWQNEGGAPNRCITIGGISTSMDFSIGKVGERC